MGCRARVVLLAAAFLALVAPGGPAPLRAAGSGRDLLTPDERAWLDRHKPPPVLAVETGYAPFVFVDASGTPRGLAYDHLALLEQKIGVRFARKQYPTLDAIFDATRRGDVQLVNAVTRTPWRSTFLAFTDPFISVPNVIIVRHERTGVLTEDDLAGLTVALVRSYAVTEYLTRKGLPFTSRLAPDDASALLDVSFGRSDAAVIDLATASYLISEKGIANLRVAGEIRYAIQLSMAVPPTEPVLLRILQKGLAAITDEERREIRDRWIHAGGRSPLSDWRILAGIGTALAAIAGAVLAVLVWNRSLRRLVALRTADLQKEKESLRDREERYRVLFEDSPEGVVVIDPRTAAIVEFNDQACRQLGYSREEYARLGIPDVEVIETPEQTQAHIRKIVENGYDEFETLHRTKQGEIRNILVKARYTGAGGPRLYHCLWRDITKDKRNEQILQARLHLLAFSEAHAADELRAEAVRHIEALTGSRAGFFHVIGDHDEGPARRGWWQECLRTHQPVILNEKGWPWPAGDSGDDPGPMERQLVVPVVRTNRVVALFGLGNKASDYTDEDATVVSHFADLVWTIIEQALVRDQHLASEQRFHALFDAAPLGIGVARHARLILANEAYARIFGYRDVPGVIGAGIADNLAPEVREELVSRHAAREAGTRVPSSYETSGLRQDGSVFPMQMDIILVQLPDGPATLAFVRDLTESKRVERALRNTLERISFAEHAAHVGFWDWDLASGKHEWSEEFYRLLGVDPHEPATFDIWSRAVHPDDRERTAAQIQKAIADRGSLEAEFRVVGPNGERWISAVGTTTRGRDGRALRVTGICTDITARKKAEAERAELESHLRRSQKMEAMGTLAGGIAHDFNNILTPIIAHAELALTELAAHDRACEDITSVLAAAERAKDLVRQILLMTRREAHGPLVPILLGPLVKEALGLLRASLPATIEIRSRLDGECGPVLGDPSQVHQVLLNLCANAGYAMRESGGALTIGLEPVTREGSGNWVRLLVRDTGPGIPRHLQERIFEPYFTTKPVGQGSGLGLAVVHGIVTKMGGEIHVTSTEGVGTTFEILWPETSEARSHPAVTAAAAPRGRGQHVMVVDDEGPIRRVLQRMLESLGYQVSAFASGAEALGALAASPEAFEAVITDYTMPGMTGLDLAAKIRSARPSLPILLGTGLAVAVDPDVAARCGLRALVTKPYDLRQLAAALAPVFDAGA